MAEANSRKLMMSEDHYLQTREHSQRITGIVTLLFSFLANTYATFCTTLISAVTMDNGRVPAGPELGVVHSSWAATIPITALFLLFCFCACDLTFQFRERMMLAHMVQVQLGMMWNQMRTLVVVLYGKQLDDLFVRAGRTVRSSDFDVIRLLGSTVCTIILFASGVVRARWSWVQPASGIVAWIIQHFYLAAHSSNATHVLSSPDSALSSMPEARSCRNTDTSALNSYWVQLTSILSLALVCVAWCSQLMAERGARAAADRTWCLEVAKELQSQSFMQQQERDREMAAIVYHELRNPLNGVMANLRLANNVPPGEPAGDHMQVALGCTEQAISFLNRMQTLEKLRAGAWDLEPEPTQLRDVLNQAAASIESQLNPGVQLVRQYNTDCWVDVDHLLLLGVLVNLLLNAVRFTTVGTVTLQCDCCIAQSDNRITARFAVCDTGCGMDHELKESVFNKYVTRGGIGVGLYLSHQQVSALGGVLTVESPRLDGLQGTGFYFELPLVLAPVPKTMSEPESTVALPRFLRVLIADDAATNRMLLKFTISKHVAPEWELSLANSAEEVLSIFKSSNKPDLLFLDENFGRIMRGSDAIKEIRLLEEQAAACSSNIVPPLRIVSCTGNCVAEDVKYLTACGANLVWGKPIPDFTNGDLQRELSAIF
jgi:signal transduction histidine kinase